MCRVPSGREVTVTAFPFPPRRAGECGPAEALGEPRRWVLPPPARAEAGLASPAPFSPAPQRRSATRAPQVGQEAGAPAARRPPPAARKMVTSAGQLALLALGTYAAGCAPPPCVPSATPRSPLSPAFLFPRGLFFARLEEWSRVRASQGLEGESIGLPGDGGELIPKRGAVEHPGLPREVATWTVRDNTGPGREAGCARAGTAIRRCVFLHLPSPPCLPGCLQALLHPARRSVQTPKGWRAPTLPPTLPASLWDPLPIPEPEQMFTVRRGAFALLTYRALELWSRFWIFVRINCFF